MAKAKYRRGVHPKARVRTKDSARRPFEWKRWALLAAGLIGAAALVYLAQTTGGSRQNSQTAALARENSGTEIRVLTGSHHTVYHSTAPLPTSDRPRADGLPTLVWFSGTWCEVCEQMEPWAHATAAEFKDRMVFVEKSVDHDRGAALRYGVRGTPTFVLIDASGRPLTQFFFQSSPGAFRSAIEKALSLAGAG